jgi:hypothetical protein
MTPAEKEQRFLHIILACGHFAGKSLKLTEAAETLDMTHINEAEDMLRRIRRWCEKQDEAKFPDLHKLASEIDKLV